MCAAVMKSVKMPGNDDCKREEFRKFLEQSGVLPLIVNGVIEILGADEFPVDSITRSPNRVEKIALTAEIANLKSKIKEMKRKEN